MVRPLSHFKPAGGQHTGNSIGSITQGSPQNIALAVCNSGDYPLETRPKLLALSMRIISAWSILDTYIARCFATMVGTEASVAVAMYASLGSTNTQHIVLRAAAAETLTPEQLKIFDDLLSLYGKRRKFRDKIAHHLWGYSAAAPDGIVLIDPKDYMREADLDLDKLSVYEQPDFEKSLSSIEELSRYLHDFYFLIGPHKHRADELLNRLKLSLGPGK